MMRIGDNNLQKLKQRKSKIRGRTTVLDFERTGGQSLISFSGDYSLMRVQFDESSDESHDLLGFVCPYCLMWFGSHRDLFKQHIDIHLGPVVCENCKVSL